MIELQPNERIRYPWLCISKIDDMVVVTTKKIASRFFEEASLLETENRNTHAMKTCDFRIDEGTGFHITNLSYTQIRSNIISVSDKELFSILNVTSLSDLFTPNYFRNNKIVFVTRQPITRFYTGFFEWVDSVIGPRLRTHLKNLPQDIIDIRLNEQADKIDYNILSDEHMSLWNTFLTLFIEENELQNYFQVIDINNTSQMSVFRNYELPQPSNAQQVNSWLSNSNNKNVIDRLNNNLKFYFDLEVNSYNKLLNTNYR